MMTIFIIAKSGQSDTDVASHFLMDHGYEEAQTAWFISRDKAEEALPTFVQKTKSELKIYEATLEIGTTN